MNEPVIDLSVLINHCYDRLEQFDGKPPVFADVIKTNYLKLHAGQLIEISESLRTLIISAYKQITPEGQRDLIGE
ncbi:MAG: hypothetical protein ACRBHB_17175 [Arenicella sp.]